MDQEALPTLKVLLEAPSALVSRKVAMYVFDALELREEKVRKQMSTSWYVLLTFCAC